MTINSTVVSLRQIEAIEDPLTTVLRSGARRLLSQAIEAEAEAFLALMKGVQLPDGRDRVVRHGHAPERVVETGIGPVEVQRVKLRDRGAGEVGDAFASPQPFCRAGRVGHGAWMRCCQSSTCA